MNRFPVTKENRVAWAREVKTADTLRAMNNGEDWLIKSNLIGKPRYLGHAEPLNGLERTVLGVWCGS